jgi:hypothetical protein
MRKSKRGGNLASVRPKGSPPGKTPQPGPYWPFGKPKIARPTNTSVLATKDSDITELKASLSAAEKQAALRPRVETPIIPKTPHHVPNRSRKGRPLSQSTLRYVASVCASGSQPTKVELQRRLNGEGTEPETTFYRNAALVWEAAKAVFIDSQFDLVQQCLRCQEPLVVAFDMGWHRRGFVSALGMLL